MSRTPPYNTSVMDASSTPLADYFWIAGIEEISYHDNEVVDPRPLSTLQLDDTIKEDNEHDIPESPTSSPSKNPTARHSRRNSLNRLSKAPSEARFSIQTVGEEDGTRSNRSSATIRAVPPLENGANGADDGTSPTADTPTLAIPPPGAGMGFTGLPDFDFDQALMKFAAEREDFLDDLSFTAGAKLQPRAPMVNNLRAERIKAEEGDASGRMSPLRSIKGSIRRKISFRDMNSVKRQTTTMRQRPGESRRTDPIPGPSEDDLLTSRSLRSDHQASEQLQLCYPASRTPEPGPRHASPQETI